MFKLSYNNRGYLVILGGFLVHLSLGSFYTYGNIQPYLVQYMQNYSFSGKDVNMGNSVWIFGLMAFGMGASVAAGGFLNAKIGPFLTVLFGGLFYSLNVCLTYFTIKTYLVVIAISDGLFVGFGMGLAYGVALATPCKWFPKRKGLILGIIVAGFGISATIFDLFQIFYIKGKLDNTIEISEKIPQSYYVIGLTYAGLITVGSLFLKDPPDTEERKSSSSTLQNEDGPSKLYAIINQDLTNDGEGVVLQPHQLFFEFDFWILWLTFALNMATVVLLMSLYKSFGLIINLSDDHPYHFLTLVSVTGALFNCAGRIFWGVMNDNKSYKAMMLTLTLSSAVLYPTFYACSRIGNLDQKDDIGRMVFFSVWIFLLNFILSGNFSIFPNICAQLFGMKHVIANYGVLFTSASFGGAVISIVTTSLWQNHPEKKILYLYAFISGGVMSLVAAGLTLLFRGKSLMRRIY